MTELTGGCLCGRIRYRLDQPRKDAGFCHCRLCQRASGAPVVAWGTFPAAAFHLTEGTLASYASSSRAVRQFCPECGTQISLSILEQPAWLDVTLASLDEPARVPPDYHIWTDSQLPWLHRADALPAYPDQGPDL